METYEIIRKRWTESIEAIFPGETVPRETARNEILDLLDKIDALEDARAAEQPPVIYVPPLSESIVTVEVVNEGQGQPSGVWEDDAVAKAKGTDNG